MAKDKFIKTYKFSKGVYEFNAYSLATRDLLYHDSKLTDANIASSINMGEITAGIGNATQIMIFDSGKFNVTLTAADIDLRQYKLQTGGNLGYNGKVMTCELIKATSTTLTLGTTPVAPYGTTSVIAYVNGDGTAYTVDPDTKQVEGFTATVDETYSVRYYIEKANAEVLNVNALFTPDIVSAELKMPIYEAPNAGSANMGTLCGYLWVIIPRYQFNGEASITASQTDNVKPSLSGQAIAADDAAVTDCSASALSSLIYLVYEPVSTTEGIENLAIIGGGVSVAENASATVPVKFVMADGALAQPDMTDLAFTSSATGTATVSAAGVVTGVAAGDCDVTVAYSELGLTAICPVTVTSA